MKKAVIIPTGDEIKSGIVIDTNSPVIMGIILELFPRAAVTRTEPAADEINEILGRIELHGDSDLIIIVGGSGGGSQYDVSLARDVTHAALDKLLPDHQIKEIYGYNGHLWSRLVIGHYKNAVVANVPGPPAEAAAAARAILTGLAEKEDLAAISARAAEAVLSQYPKGGKD